MFYACGRSTLQDREDAVENSLISLAKTLIGALALIMLFEIGTLL